MSFASSSGLGFFANKELRNAEGDTGRDIFDADIDDETGVVCCCCCWPGAGEGGRAPVLLLLQLQLLIAPTEEAMTKACRIDPGFFMTAATALPTRSRICASPSISHTKVDNCADEEEEGEEGGNG